MGGPGFTPSRFPGLEEDRHMVGARILAQLTDTMTMSVFLGQVVKALNTARSQLVGVGFTTTLGRGQPAF